ncbi:MAG TPA: lamin tail domain-containing protein, partial [Patescibacteria group bacterium]|nr:lamin tail domain-containing protein [Patescibacteria group bacterium]
LSTETLSSTTIEANGYLVIPQSVSKIYLNNDGDTISLLQPNETLLDSTTYADAEKGVSWSFKNQKWQWSTIVTNGAENMVANIEDPEEQSTVPENTNEEKINEPAINNQQNEVSSTDSADSDISENSSETTEEEETPIPYQTSNDIVLNELLPNPEGSDSTDEWIEIMNTGKKPVSLLGWKLTDYSKYYTIDDITIDSGERIVFEVSKTKISLNNSGDTVHLIDPFDKIIHETIYEESKEGESWARFDTVWKWTTTLTPGEKNVFSEENVNSSAESNKNATDTHQTTSNSNNTGTTPTEEEEIEDEDEQEKNSVISIHTFRTLEDGELATIEGVVTVMPGVFGSQYFYIQDEESGVQVYSYSKAFPKLQVGDRIRVSGEKSTSRNETRIKTAAVEDIVVIAHGTSIEPTDVSNLDESLEGMLVSVEGMITEKSSSYALIEDMIKIVVKSSTTIDMKLLEEGKEVAMIGIVGQYDEEYRMMPRNNDDITKLESEEAEISLIPSAQAASANSLDQHKQNQLQQTGFAGASSLLQAPQKQTAFLVVVIIGLLAVIISVVIRYKKLQQKNDANNTLNSSTNVPHSTEQEIKTIFDFAQPNKKS